MACSLNGVHTYSGPGSLSGGQTILVVEDEVLVRLVIAEYLRECGYAVHEARSAAIAGELCEAGPLMRKPYSPERVLDRIKQLLAKAGRSLRARWSAAVSA
jgi:hypothetical protein